jgi:hypothetical protein
MIQNKVAESELVSVDLNTFIPSEKPVLFDLKDFLFKGLILKEKDYRQALQNMNWDEYREKYVLVLCSADVIIPVWAYMLAVVYLEPVAKEVYFNNEHSWKETMIFRGIDAINTEEYINKRVIIKGCGEEPVPESAFFYITKKLLPFVKSLMYGEPCSTVPVFKKK